MRRAEYRFGSDANEQLFRDLVEGRGLRWQQTENNGVAVDDADEEIDALADELGGQIMSETGT